MGKLGRIICGAIALGGFYAAYRLFEYWWNIYNKVFAVITPLQQELASWGFWGGIILVFLSIGMLSLAVSD